MEWYKGAIKLIFAITVILITGVFTTPVFGSVMESTNWKLEKDSINFGGGWGASESYIEEDTIGEIATGWSYSDIYSLHAGYQQMDEETYLSLTMNTTTNMSPAIPGLSGGSSTGQEDIIVETNNGYGYTLEIDASTSPAMKKGAEDDFSDYAPGGSAPDYDWTIADTISAFGFTPEGADIVQLFRDDGSANCNILSGSDTGDRCWDGFSTTATIISRSNAPNNPDGATTTVKLKAESGQDHLQLSGTYHAYLTVTAYVN